MTQDEIMGMAQQCGLIGMRPHLDGIYSEALEAFAKLVAAKAEAKEREACAKQCEGINSLEDYYGERIELACAEAIRARAGEQK
jgi:hypothetical protein